MHPKKISQTGVDLVKEFEGLHEVRKDGMVYAYKCSAGVMTCGYGATRKVFGDTVWTQDYAEKRLMSDLNEHAEAIKSYVTVPLTQNQYDALTSFIFNLGAGAFKSSTLLKKLNKSLYHEVPEQFMRWNKARVKGTLTPLAGLTRRRAAEAALFSADAEMTTKDGAPTMVQKPVATAPKSLAKSKTMAGAGIAGAATAMNEVAGQIQGLVSYAPMLKTVFLLCAIGGIALAAYARFKDSKDGIH
jgi:lysozyme